MPDDYTRLNSATNRRLHCRACDAETLHVVHGYECTECGTPRLWHAKVKVLPAAGPWVSVEERLPETPGYYLARLLIDPGEASHYITPWGDGGWSALNYLGIGDKVTHWAPINPPREETKR